MEEDGEVNWCSTPVFNHVWLYMYMALSFHGWRNKLFNLPLATDNYLSWDSNPIREGRVVSKRDPLITRSRRPLTITQTLRPHKEEEEEEEEEDDKEIEEEKEKEEKKKKRRIKEAK